jgi:hypothetical protein
MHTYHLKILVSQEVDLKINFFESHLEVHQYIYLKLANTLINLMWHTLEACQLYCTVHSNISITNSAIVIINNLALAPALVAQ